MNKMAYQKPWAELIQFENEDVVNTSLEASCTAETGCTGGCVAPGWDKLGICECGIHEGSIMMGEVMAEVCIPFFGGSMRSVTKAIYCHSSFEQGAANAGYTLPGSGGRSGGLFTDKENFNLGLEDWDE